MLSLLKRAYITAREWRYFILRDELKSTVSVPLLTRLRMLRHGFRGQSWILFDLANNDRTEYISDLQRIRMGRLHVLKNIRAGYPIALDNKLYFEAIAGRYYRVPKVHAYIERGRIFALTDEWQAAAGEAGSLEAFSRIAPGKPVVLKPLAGAEGAEVLFIQHEDGKWLLNWNAATPEQIERTIQKLNEYMVCEFIEQGAFGASLYPRTTNTMRLLTMWDVNTNEPFIPAAAQRIGTKRSEPVDNWARGGLSASIDCESGQLSRAASCPIGKARLSWHENHPDTGSPIAGLHVPNWLQVKSDLLDAARRLPYLKLIAWDLVITDNGVVAIEGNATTGVNIFQVHKPLLRDPRVRAFFKHHRIV